nr:hypothetical protein [Micromonospora sp. DSM 115978]
MNAVMITYPCPACGAPARLDSGCPRCRRPPDPTAAEVVRLDGEIAGLTVKVEQSRQAYAALAATLRDTQRRRDDLAARVRVSVAATVPTGPGPTRPAVPGPSAPTPVGPVAPAPGPSIAAASGAVAVRPETSTRTVQNILFILGGLLVGTAAVIFTVVAWSAVGVAGRAAILAGLTALTLAAPLLARWRGLTATAETFAALGLLLVVLDGYAAWSVDLFGVAGWPGTRYAALAGGASAAIAAGYGLTTRLAAGWFAAFVAVQPVVPLAAAEFAPGPTGWALAFAAVAALDLAIIGVLRRRPTDGAPDGVRLARQVVAFFGYGTALLVSGACGLAAWLIADGPGPAGLLSGVPLLVVALLILAGAILVRRPALQALAAGLLVVVLGAAAIRPIAETDLPLLAGAAAVVALLAGLVAGTAPLLPAAVRPGPRVGGLLLSGPLAVIAGTMTLTLAAVLAARSLPAGRTVGEPVDLFDWQLAVAVPLVAAAVAILLPAAGRPVAVLVGAVSTVLALPAAVPLPFWAVAAVEFAVAAPLILGAARNAGPRPLLPVLGATAGGLLAGHALLVALGTPAGATAALLTLMLIGLAAATLADTGSAGAARVAATLADTGPEAAADAAVAGAGPVPGAAGAAPDVERATAGSIAARRRVIGGLALAVALAAAPALAVAALRTGDVVPWWQGRVALAVAVLLAGALLAVRSRWPAYQPYAAAAVALGALATGLAPTYTGLAEPAGTYAAIGLLAVTAALLVGHRTAPATPTTPTTPADPGGVALLLAGLGLALRAAVAVAPAVAAVLLAPYGWLGEGWAGAPDGVGLAPRSAGVEAAAGANAAATLAIVTVVAGLAGWLWRRTRIGVVLAALPAGAVTLLVVLAALGADWPTVPAVALALGLGCLLAAAVRTGGAVEVEKGGDAAGAPTGSARGGRTAIVTTPLGLALAGSGLAGLLPTPASTIAAFGLVVAVAATIGAAGRALAARVAGWSTAAGAGFLLAIAAASAVDLPLRTAALAVLAVAAVALAGGTALRGRRPVESTALLTAGHAGAVVAVLLTVGHLRHAAAICTLWGVALGLSALRPGESTGRRWLLAVVAAGCELAGGWLLLAAGDVAVLEAYTLPAAAAALLAGWLAVRAWPGLNSWIGYGPGLAAALLPSLASVLAAGDQPWRRLLLGTGALVAVVLGARWRRQAPVVLAGGTLAVLACYELVAVWDRLPRWAFLAAGGFALIALATTYERRRRDVARLRSAVGRMT